MNPLKEKLKCLVFIPIISRTYCDPKSFAWEHEFKAFVELASQDKFGLKIKLPNGNVANRVLPVSIHGLDQNDIKQYESVLGGVLRGIEFVYRSTGVNRPLRAYEDHPQDNLNKTYYRDQINKVANAIDEIIGSLRGRKIGQPGEKNKIKEPLEEVSKEQKSAISGRKITESGSIGFHKKRSVDIQKVNGNNKWWLIPAILLVILSLILGTWLINRKIRTNWSISKVLPQAEISYHEGNCQSAFNLLQIAGRYISNNQEFKRLDSLISTHISIYTDPSGVKVTYKEYSDTSEIWKLMGITPIDSFKVPVRTLYKFKMVKHAYDTVIAAEFTGFTGEEPNKFYRKLFITGTIPSGMVHVAEYNNDTTSNYFIDKFEVTNRQFKEFINSGGYQKEEYWKYPFIKDKKALNLEEARALMVDKTGRLGPSTWQAGDYPENEEDFPVSGVSWYEAAAYAEFAGEEIPTVSHWNQALGLKYLNSYLIPESNFSGQGPAKVGYYKGMNAYGTYDMAGNIREWCFNGKDDFRAIRGGSWSDPLYTYSFINMIPAFDRSEKNGFRCVKYIDKKKIPDAYFMPLPIMIYDSSFWYKMKPIPDDVFKVVKNQFSYVRTDLNANIEWRDDKNKDWICEKITFNTVYDDKRMMVYLFLPKSLNSPYQTVILFPGYDGFDVGSSEIFAQKIGQNYNFILKDGRAFLFPVYYGALERKNDALPSLVWNQMVINTINDFRRSIDYLETRADIDSQRLCVMGTSFGGIFTSLVPAIDERLKVSIIVVSGFGSVGPQKASSESFQINEMDQINFINRVKIPTLMLNGKYDTFYSYEYQVKPMFNLLGTQSSDKRLKVYETDHGVPYNELVKETLSWLDKYLGPTKH